MRNTIVLFSLVHLHLSTLNAYWMVECSLMLVYIRSLPHKCKGKGLKKREEIDRF